MNTKNIWDEVAAQAVQDRLAGVGEDERNLEDENRRWREAIEQGWYYFMKMADEVLIPFIDSYNNLSFSGTERRLVFMPDHLNSISERFAALELQEREQKTGLFAKWRPEPYEAKSKLDFMMTEKGHFIVYYEGQEIAGSTPMADKPGVYEMRKNIKYNDKNAFKGVLHQWLAGVILKNDILALSQGDAPGLKNPAPDVQA